MKNLNKILRTFFLCTISKKLVDKVKVNAFIIPWTNLGIEQGDKKPKANQFFVLET